MIGCLPTQALAFLAVFVYATHATQTIAFEWKPGLSLTVAAAAHSTSVRPSVRPSVCLSRDILNISRTALTSRSYPSMRQARSRDKLPAAASVTSLIKRRAVVGRRSTGTLPPPGWTRSPRPGLEQVVSADGRDDRRPGRAHQTASRAVFF